MKINLAILFVQLLFVHQARGVIDETLQPNAKGHDVVETVCSNIESVCIFPDSNLMLRRIAHVETNDGLDASTYSPGYYGGIWKVDQSAFLATKQLSAAIYTSIQTHFNIDWTQVTWQDLLKPFYSGLAARLYLYSLTADLPKAVSDQANFWAAHYRNGSQASVYVDRVALLQKSCKGLADIVFIVDGSGSISAPNFLLVKSFLKNVIKSLNIGPDPKVNTRVSVVQFSDDVHLEFDLDDHSTVAGYEQAVDNILYLDSGTQTDVALDYLVDQSFLPSAGARGSEVPKIGIVITDGASNDYQKTLVSAARVHSSKITVFTIGVGANLNFNELKAIATDPDCKHLFNLNTFTEFDSLVEAIEKKTCGAPLILSNTTVTITINESRNCQLEVGPNGLIVEITGLGQSTIYFSNYTFPTPSYYDYKYKITYVTPTVVYFKGAYEGKYVVYCHIEPCKESTLTFDPTYNDPCKPDPCPCGYHCVRKPNNCFGCVADYPVETYSTTTTSTIPLLDAYDCDHNNPCTPANAALNKFYFTYHDPTKFVQCSEWGQCYIMPCPSGLVWNQQLYTCNWN